MSYDPDIPETETDFDRLIDSVMGVGGASRAFKSKSTLQLLREITPRRVCYTVLPIDEAVVRPGEHYLLRAMPQVSFKGNWLFAHEAGPNLRLVDVTVGHASCLPSYGPIPLSMWNVEAYLKAFRLALPFPGATASADKLLQMLGSTPAFERMRIDFPTSEIGNVISLRVENTGAYPEKVVCAIHGQATYSPDEWGEATAFGPLVPLEPAGADPNTKVSSEPSSSTLPHQSEARPTVDALFATCPTCGAGPQMACYGVARGGVHPRRGRGKEKGKK